MMRDEESADRRKWQREPVQIPAMFFIEDSSARCRYCTVTSISRNGATILLPGYEFLRENTYCCLDIIVPKTFRRLSLRGLVRIKKRHAGDLVADIQFGIHFAALLPESTFTKLLGAEPLQGWHSVLQKQLAYGPSAFKMIS
jgi:hypothetical protein